MQGNYYGILPAHIRYDQDIKMPEKVMYAEITALASDTGCCWASNKYFAEMFGISTSSVTKWLSNLAAKGYIEIEMILKPNSKEVDKRIIRLPNVPKVDNYFTPSENDGTPLPPNYEGNYISNNITNNSNTIDKPKDNKDIEVITEIITYLNNRTGRRYSPSTPSTQKHISGRLKDGYTVQDFKTVIDNKVASWKGTSMENYLRPETLFNPTKFESYLNEKVQPAQKGFVLEDSPWGAGIGK